MPRPPAPFGDLVDRFWSYVDRRSEFECWPWTGEVNGMGYGRLDVWSGGKRQRYLAHRLMLRFAGQPPAVGEVVMHACDNPICVNPGHLSVGTQADNLEDMRAKGRDDQRGLALGRELRHLRRSS